MLILCCRFLKIQPLKGQKGWQKYGRKGVVKFVWENIFFNLKISTGEAGGGKLVVYKSRIIIILPHFYFILFIIVISYNLINIPCYLLKYFEIERLY